MADLTGQANGATKQHQNKERGRGARDRDSNRSSKRAIGTIHQCDPNKKGELSITAWVSATAGGRRLWGDGRKIIIIDSPLDLLMRFGGLVPGMVVEITWRGINETSQAYARILAEASTDEAVKSGEQVPQRKVDTQSSLPFEPFGI